MSERPILHSLTIASLFTVISFAASAQEEWRRIDQTQYVGAKKCAECHQDYFDGWEETLHAKMIQPVVTEGPDKTVVADFSQESEHRDFELKDVKWVVGSRWKQRFIGEVDENEVVFPAQWSVSEKTWQPYRGRGDWWYPYHQDWKERSNFKLCAGCHSTGVDHYTQSWAELNISCESCHGPGKSHSDTPLIANIVNPSRLDIDRSMDICLSCHQSGKPPGTEYAWPVGYQPGLVLSKFWEAFTPVQAEETSEFWKNGTAHKNRVQGNTYVHSKMEREGIQCTVCHESHSARHLSLNTRSAATNALCLMCHGPAKDIGPDYDTLSDHTHHAPTSVGSKCIECHMVPTGRNGTLLESRNHTFNFISPADTIQYGAPNSCNVCHSDQTSEWALALVKEWYD